jgi:hypothetical protein
MLGTCSAPYANHAAHGWAGNGAAVGDTDAVSDAETPACTR